MRAARASNRARKLNPNAAPVSSPLRRDSRTLTPFRQSRGHLGAAVLTPLGQRRHFIQVLRRCEFGDYAMQDGSEAFHTPQYGERDGSEPEKAGPKSETAYACRH